MVPLGTFRAKNCRTRSVDKRTKQPDAATEKMTMNSFIPTPYKFFLSSGHPLCNEVLRPPSQAQKVGVRICLRCALRHRKFARKGGAQSECAITCGAPHLHA